MTLIEILIKFEGLKLQAYKCPAGVATIGIGTTVYPNGKKVQMGDTCTRDEAIEYAMNDIVKFKKGVVSAMPATVPEKSIDALVSFAYNVGLTAALKSTLFKVIKENKNNLAEIEKQFMRWNKAGGKELPGLTKRRKAEFELYKQGILDQYTKAEIYEMFKCNLK